MQNTSYDFVFIGLGASNCLLIRNLAVRGLLDEKNIAIIEPDKKVTNDRTFCFWMNQEELNQLHLTDLVSYGWNKIGFDPNNKESISPLKYYHIKGIDVYDSVREILNQCNSTFYFQPLLAEPSICDGLFEIYLSGELLKAHVVFDSRPPEFSIPNKNESHIYQSFYGWEIVTADNQIDNEAVVLMDFSIEQQNSCQFMYVLPFESNRALFEVTRFGKDKITEQDADAILKSYLRHFKDYRIVSTEKGVISMSSAKTKVVNYGENWIFMGTKANMVKPSTGYAFHTMAKDAAWLASRFQSGQSLQRKKTTSRFHFYDRLLLKILEKSPALGKEIFLRLFTKISILQVLFFLNERTTIGQELKIFSKLQIGVFIKRALIDIAIKISQQPPTIIAFLFTLFAVIMHGSEYESIVWIMVIVGFLTIGLSHGSLDHLTTKKSHSIKQMFSFIVSFVSKAVLFGVVWYLQPDVALILFLGYSAWHFGQADCEEWGMKSITTSIVWGLSVLFLILFYHFDSTLLVLAKIPELSLDQFGYQLTSNQLMVTQLSGSFVAFLCALLNRSRHMFTTLIYLHLAMLTPLMVAFGIYFVFQHSFHGWRHLKSSLGKSSAELWLQSLPFSFAGAVILGILLFYNWSHNLAYGFIFLSCVSLPHVMSMHSFYKLQDH